MGFILSSFQCFLLFCDANFARAFADSAESPALALAVNATPSESTFRHLYLKVLPRDVKLWEVVICSSVPLLMFWLAQLWRSSDFRALDSTDDRDNRNKKGRRANKSVDDSKSYLYVKVCY
jgi:hypothetical protein